MPATTPARAMLQEPGSMSEQKLTLTWNKRSLLTQKSSFLSDKDESTVLEFRLSVRSLLLLVLPFLRISGQLLDLPLRNPNRKRPLLVHQLLGAEALHRLFLDLHGVARRTWKRLENEDEVNIKTRLDIF